MALAIARALQDVAVALAVEDEPEQHGNAAAIARARLLRP
jgi:hypothetical protein